MKILARTAAAKPFAGARSTRLRLVRVPVGAIDCRDTAKALEAAGRWTKAVI